MKKASGKRRQSLIVLDAATDSNAVVITRRYLRDHSPRHDRHMIAVPVSRQASAFKPGTAHSAAQCAVCLYVTSLLAASFSLPAVVTDSRVKPATDHRSGVPMTCPLTPHCSTHRCHTLTLACKRAVNSKHILYDIGCISRV